MNEHELEDQRVQSEDEALSEPIPETDSQSPEESPGVVETTVGATGDDGAGEVEADEEAPAKPEPESAAEDTSSAPAMESEQPSSALGAADTALPDMAAARRGPEVPWWPYLLYLAAWIALVAATILSIAYDAGAPPAYEQPSYPVIVIGGLVLVLLGPVLSLMVWLAVWMRSEKGERGGLLTSALVKGAGVTLFGSLAWYATVVAVDALRLGIIG